MLMNIIKMICYRAETAVANELGAYLKNYRDEKRMLVKQIIHNNADILPDYEKDVYKRQNRIRCLAALPSVK